MTKVESTSWRVVAGARRVRSTLLIYDIGVVMDGEVDAFFSPFYFSVECNRFSLLGPISLFFNFQYSTFNLQVSMFEVPIFKFQVSGFKFKV